MNSPWQIDLFDGLNQSTSMQDILDATLKITKRFGFDYVGWKAMLPLPISKKRILALNTAEDGTLEKIGDGTYDNTPVPSHCSRSMEPISWLGTRDDWLFTAVPEIMEDVYSCGRFGGWAQSLVESNRIYNMFWVDTSSPVSQKDINHVKLEMEWISTSIFLKMNQARQIKNIILSEREKEVLRWSGDGKTAEDISKILHLSQSTINFHIRNAMYKLDAPNKTNAVVKSVYLGLLY